MGEVQGAIQQFTIEPLQKPKGLNVIFICKVAVGVGCDWQSYKKNMQLPPGCDSIVDLKKGTVLVANVIYFLFSFLST